MSVLSGWWPASKGIGAITNQNFSNLLTDTAQTTYAGGAVYIPTCDDEFPFKITGDESKLISVKVSHITWERVPGLKPGTPGAPTYPDIRSLNKSYYNSISSGSDEERKFKSWSMLVSSIDDITEQANVYSQLKQNAPQILSSNTNIYQNESIVIKYINNDIPFSEYLTGVMSDYSINKESKIFTIDDQRVSSDQLMSAYADAIANANSYLEYESKNSESKWFENGFSIPNTMFMLIAHTPGEDGLNFLKNIRTKLWAPADICSSKCGFQYIKGNISWSESNALSAIADDYLEPALIVKNEPSYFFHIGLAQGDIDSSDAFNNNIKVAINDAIKVLYDNLIQLAKNNPNNVDSGVSLVVNQLIANKIVTATSGSLEKQVTQQILANNLGFVASTSADGFSTNSAWASSTRKWAFEGTDGQYTAGFAGTLFNASKPKGEIPKVDCVIIAPIFAVIPEVYQCLMQQGPAWEFIVKNNILTDEEKDRLKYRKYIFLYQFLSLSVNRIFIQGKGVSENKKTALPAGGLPARAIRYALPIKHSLNGFDFDITSARYIWPDNKENDRTTNLHVKLYNPLFPGKGASHSWSLKLEFIGQDIGTFMGAMIGASGGLTGVMAGTALGEAMRMYNVTYTGFLSTYRMLKSDLLWNPYQVRGSSSSGTAIQQLNIGLTYNHQSDIPDEGKPLTADKVVKVLDASPKDWKLDTASTDTNVDEKTNTNKTSSGNNITTWAIWPDGWAKQRDDSAYLTRGLIDLKFRARCAILGKNPDFSDITDVDLSKYAPFIEFRFYAVDLDVEKKTIDQFMATLGGESRHDDSKVDSILGKWEFLLPAYNNAGPNHAGCGREFVWKYYCDGGYDSTTGAGGFEALRAKSNRIFSPILDNTVTSYDLSFFLDNFRGDSDAPRLVTDRPDLNLGPRFLEAGNLYFFMNARAFFINKQTSSQQKSENLTVLFDMEGSNISIPAKLLERRIECSQSYQDGFVKNFPDNSNILPNLISTMNSSVKSKIEENNMIYDSSITGYPNTSEFVNLDISTNENDLPSFYIRSALIASNIEKTVAMELLPGLSSATTHFITPNGLTNLVFLGGDASQYWKVVMQFGDAKLEDGSNYSNILKDLLIMINIDYVDINGIKSSIAKNQIIDMSSQKNDGGKFELYVGPITQDITILGSGWIILSITSAIYNTVNKNQSGTALISLYNNIEIDHLKTIGKISVTGERVVTHARSISWYRGLTTYGGATPLGTDAVFVTDGEKQSFFTFGSLDTTFIASLITPEFVIDMAEEYGWVLEAEYTDSQSSVGVSLLRANPNASSKNSLTGASNEYGGIDILNIDQFSGEIRMRSITTKYAPTLSSFVLNVDGNNVVGDDAAIAESSNIGYEQYKSESHGSLISITDNKSFPDHPRTSFYIRNNHLSTEATNNKSPVLYDINNTVLSYNPASKGYSIIVRHISGCYLIGDINNNGRLIMPLRYIEGRIPDISKQITGVSKENGAIDNDIIIDHYPYNVISKGFFDARTGAKNNLNITNDMISVNYEVPRCKKYNGGNASFANLDGIKNYTFKGDISRNGVEVSYGKPAFIIDKTGGMYLFYSYSTNFLANGVSSDCSPFIGRIYCVYSGNNGLDWTPPVCVLNLSPFNPKTDMLNKRYDSMIKSMDTDTNIFYGGLYPEFDTSINTIKSLGVLNSDKMQNISLEDFDVIYERKTNNFYVSYWFGGFICYSFLGPIIDKIKDMWSLISKITNDSVIQVNGHPVDMPDYSVIYNQKEISGKYSYTSSFWDPGYRTPILIAAGPVSKIINNDTINPPVINSSIDDEATCILKSYGIMGSGNANLMVNKEIVQYNNKQYNKYYSDYWKGTISPYIYIKFGNNDYNIEQNKQKPIMKYMDSKTIDILFYNADSSFAHIPLTPDGTLVSEGFPQVIGSI